VHAQRQDPRALAAGQRALLDALGFDWQAGSPHERNWKRGYAAAVRYHAAHGNLTVPQKYVDSEGVRLGIWINNIRRRKERLPAWKVALLDALGMSWRTKRHTGPV
jgi:Helicase associated domain